MILLNQFARGFVILCYILELAIIMVIINNHKAIQGHKVKNEQIGILFDPLTRSLKKRTL